MNSSETIPPSQPLTQNSIRLEIKGLQHVPSFKNTKSIFRNKQSGKPFIATKPERKLWMDQATRSIESQLLSAFATHDLATSTVPLLRSWIASYLPLDDSIKWVVELSVKGIQVDQGCEGATIEIQKL